ncbi:efflux RND transporter permease subunit [Sphingomonas paeninsulae]|uniref:Efflux RND transporter permease subunit n=1 Tax=Sphingomonas paeninsulae TaxID=2319844 RepID=A0A494T8H1_SPHPE|nr:efflux RND transporter permease subunit [Sphingomonas paeninsulae]AYJ85627.1 efflux RND transporter permease subunit [Sphingomonas paeninsulae]
MSFRNISAWAIRNPVAPIVLFVALTLAGIVSFMQMSVNNNPDIAFPAAQVVVNQPGAAPTEMETQVAQKVEAALRGINGVEDMSTRIDEGSSQTFVQFNIGTSVDRAVNDVRDAIANIRGDLPDGILEPQVTRIDIDGGPIAFFSAEAVDMTLEQLSWYVDNTVAKRLLTVSGMAAIQRSGGVSREIRVVLDPVLMQGQGITAAQVNAQLRSMNLNAAGGRAEIAGSEQAVRVIGNAKNAFSLGETMISIGGGRSVKLSDIATVRDLYAEQRQVAKMNGRQVLSFSLAKSKGASDVAVYDEGLAVLKALEKENPKIHFTQLYTSVDYTKEQYHSAIDAMWEGAVLAVLVVFLFLRDWRATAISALAIPLSAIPAFWFMNLMGFTLNGISLLALSLVAGVLVDDAIVEIENIVRHMRMGKTAYQASIDAADEIGLAVMATTMSIVAVFLPVGLMPGVSGQFFKQFGLTIVAAVLVSLAVARLITPMVAAYFLKSHGAASHGESPLMHRYMALLRWSLDKGKSAAVRQKVGFKRHFARLADHRTWVMGIGFAAFLLTILAFGTLQFTGQPTVNTDYSQVKIEMAPGATLHQTEVVADQVSRVLHRAPEVAAAFSDVSVGSANVFITLRKDRTVTSVEFERSMAAKLREIPDARVTFQSQSGGLGRDVSIMLAGSDPDVVTRTAQKLVEEMSHLKELRAPRIDGDLQRPEVTIKPRLDVAADLGVTTTALSQTIRIATQGEIDQNAAKFSLSDRQIPIRVMLDETARTNLSTIENMPVPTVSGGSVPLKVVAEIGFGAGPSVLRRYNQNRRLAIGADFAPGVVTASKEIDALPTMKNLPQGVARVSFGDDKFQAEMMGNFIKAVLSGVLLVFAVLVLLYRRVLPPFVNMGSLLLAPLGGAIALHLTGNPLSLPVLIGLLMLLGIVAKNSILLVDFALEEMNKGIDRTTAILDAGHKRAQPIVMTTVAMVAGMLPIALSFSGDGSWRAPMGIVVIGGLLLSTVLTLVIVPPLFSLAIGFEARIGPRLRRRFTNGGGRAPEGVPTAAE